MSRVYAVAAWLLELGPSGASQRLLAILRALPDLLRPDERVVVLHAGPPPLAARSGLALQAVPVPACPTWRRVLAERLVLPRILRDLRADLLHLESLPVPRLPCPVVLTVHDLRDLGPYRRRSRWLFARTLRQGVARAAALIAPSAFTARELQAATSARAVTIVPGVLDADWVAGPCTESAWPGCFLHVGHLEPRKNLDLLLDAYARASASAPLPPLVLAGRDAGSGNALRDRARQLGVSERVVFLGPVDDDTLRGLYRGARVVLVPSRYEGFGLPALEALAFGRALVVSDQGALPEVVGDAGHVLPADDVEAWSNALVSLATRPLDEPVSTTSPAEATRLSAITAAQVLVEVWRRMVD